MLMTPVHTWRPLAPHIFAVMSSIHTCTSSHPGQNKLNELRLRSQELQLEILTIKQDFVEITSSDSDSFATVMLTNCTQLVHLMELIVQELRENWQSLKYHTTDEFHPTNLTTLKTEQTLSTSSHSATSATSRVSLKREVEQNEGETCREGVCEQQTPEVDEWFTQYVSGVLVKFHACHI